MNPVRPTVTVVGRRMDRTRTGCATFPTRIAQPYARLDAGTPEADEILARHGESKDDLPVFVDAIAAGVPTAGHCSATRSRSRRACPPCSPPATPRHGSTKRVAGAIGDGAMASALAQRRLAELRDGR
jgi:hypothetical protein